MVMVLRNRRKYISHPYDHPYFGQVFLASILGVINYPNSLNVSGSGNTEHSIQMLYVVPRLVMGILAVIDTFVVFKITECRYSRKVAFIASVFFAVMPVGWFIRRLWLESIQLPYTFGFNIACHSSSQWTNKKS